jgi:hypothetical protein
MLANLKIICQFHAHSVHQNSVETFWAEIYRGLLLTLITGSSSRLLCIRFSADLTMYWFPVYHFRNQNIAISTIFLLVRVHLWWFPPPLVEYFYVSMWRHWRHISGVLFLVLTGSQYFWVSGWNIYICLHFWDNILFLKIHVNKRYGK